jgi:hypothetical protein
MQIHKHPKIATHHDEGDQDDAAECQAKAGGNVHEALQGTDPATAGTVLLEPSHRGLTTCKG